MSKETREKIQVRFHLEKENFQFLVNLKNEKEGMINPKTGKTFTLSDFINSAIEAYKGLINGNL